MVALDTAGDAVRSARTLTAALLALAFGIAFALRWVPRPTALAVLELPVVLAGVVAPVIGFRLHALLRERGQADETPAVTRSRYRRSVLLPMTVSAIAAVFGAATFVATDEPLTLIGLATHLLLAGALWPSESRYELFAAADRHDA